MATGSLLGKADATLVQGAFREAMADVPADMSGVYEKREKTLKDFTTEVNKIWEKQFEEYKAFETRITDKSNLALTNALQGKTNDNLLGEVESQVNRIKDKMKTFDKRDKGNIEWKKLEEELNKLVITTGANAEMFNGLNEAVTNGELHILGGDPKTLELYEAIVDDYNNNSSLTKGKYVDGDFVYTHPSDPNVTMTFAELQKKLEIIDPRVPAASQTVLNGVKKYAASSKNPLTDRYTADINNQLVKLMRTPNDRVNVMHERFEGLDYSFYEALTTGKDPVLQAQIHDALLSVGTDIDGDNIPDTKETYLNTDNAVALQKEIINGPHSKQIIADFLTNNIVADNYQIGVNERKVDPKKKTETTTNPYGKGGVIPGFSSAGWQTGETLQKRRNQAENNYPFTGVAGKYKPTGDGMWILNDDEENPMSTYSVFDQEGLIQSGDTPQQYGTKQEVEQDFTTSNIDIFKNSNQSSAITKINKLYDFDSVGMKLIKPPGVISGGLARLLNIGGKGNMLVVQGPSGGFYDFDTFDKNGELLEYGGKSGVKPPKGAQPLTFNLNESHNTAEDMLKKLQKLVSAAGINQNTAMPMTPVVGGGGAADEL